MKWFIRIDDFLINWIFQRFAHWFEKITGLNNFWLARFCVCIFALVPFLKYVMGETYSPTWAPLHALTPVVVVLIFFKVINQTEQETMANLQFGVANTYRIYPQTRLLVVFIAITLLIFSMLGLEQSILLVIFYYFLACTPRPPSKSLFKKWLEKIQQMFISHLAPAPSS